MTKRLLLSVGLLLSVLSLNAQTFAWGVKGGLLLGLQKWEGLNRDPLIKYQGSIFIESVPENNTYYEEPDLITQIDSIESVSERNEFALFAQGGLHLKGSAIRNQRFFFQNGEEYRPPTTEFIFRNLSVVLGAKQKFDFGATGKKFYSFGIRADYTLNTNLDDFKSGSIPAPFTFPDNFFVRKFNYGATVGGGLEFPFNELVGTIVELTINPDVSFQYRQPPLGNVTNPNNPSQIITIPERKIVNVSVELSVGFRFLRKVEYID